MTKAIIFTDGASKGNPGPGGWGTIVSLGERVVELGGAEKHTTNNRMELQAVHGALTFLKAEKVLAATIYTDSQYVLNGATKWHHGWRKRDWKTLQKADVLNRDIWEPFLATADDFELEWINVGGHVGIPGNERADVIATSFAEGKGVPLYDGPGRDYGLDLTSVAFDASKQSQKSASRERSRQKAYSYVSEVGGEVQVHHSWPECESRVRGKRARFKKATSPAEEAQLVAEFSKQR